ncbi:hypothetical protein MIND_01395300 [Mycena indigotica]|uniref:Uncharacterized protein n=1 Tax=Mycena indigotica TaxID=2126181 RepID=A0A8H6RYM0_9AGAR|nr:uncharacterized protein MIND_01395300 [Mycena indigotica]KAF7289333.1 hypothetical protein MIND_01395300 [Mycena indigotica]
MSPYYGPDEDQKTIEYERNFIAGDVIAGTGYGAQLVLYVSCALFLWKRRRHGLQPKILLAYMTLMLLIESLFVAVQARTVQMVYIDNRNYPEGPWEFFLSSQTAAVNVIFLATLFLMTFLSDLLVLWRCLVIWQASGQTTLAWVVTAVPGVMIFGSFILGTLWTFYSTRPASSFYNTLPLHIGTAYYAVSLGANVILTLLIIGRLVVYRRTLLDSLPPELANHYISLATVIVESAALYSVFAILFLITYALDNPTNQIWLGVASACQQIANLLIIYRLADGSAWQRDTLTTKTAPIHFKSGGGGMISTHGGNTSFHIAAPPPVSAGSSDPDSDFTETTNKHERSEIV